MDLLRRVHIEIALGRDPGQVWLVESGAQEEGLAGAGLAREVLLHDLDDAAGGAAVGLVLIAIFGFGPGELDTALVADGAPASFLDGSLGIAGVGTGGGVFGDVPL